MENFDVMIVRNKQDFHMNYHSIIKNKAIYYFSKFHIKLR